MFILECAGFFVEIVADAAGRLEGCGDARFGDEQPRQTFLEETATRCVT
jgi:hypothetical protein